MIVGFIDVVLVNVLIEILNVYVRIEGEYGAGVSWGMGFVFECVLLMIVGEDFENDFKVGGFVDSL